MKKNRFIGSAVIALLLGLASLGRALGQSPTNSFLSADSTMRFRIISKNTVAVAAGPVMAEGHLVIPETASYGGKTYTVTQVGYPVGNQVFNFSFITTIDSVTLPNTVTHLFGQAFARCTGMKYCKMSDSIVNIGYAAFAQCNSLGAVDFGPKLKVIDREAFYYCYPFDTLRLPASLETIGMQAFSGCLLEHIEAHPDNLYFSSRKGVLYTKAFDTLLRYPPVTPATSFDVPETVKMIGNVSFTNASNIHSINIPESVTAIGYGAFLKSDLTKLTLPNSVEFINYNAFNGNENLKQVNFGTGLKYIGQGCFYRCAQLKSVSLPASLEYLGETAFSRSGLENTVKIPSKVSFIGPNVFDYVYTLHTVEVDAANPYYSSKDGIIYNKRQDTAVFCPRGKRGQVTLSGNLVHVLSKSFKGCELLEDVVLPNTVKSLGSYAFSSCKRLETINLQKGLVRIDTFCFSNCHSLKNMKLPEGLETIAPHAFEWCKALEAVVIPNSVTTLGSGAFLGNSALKTFHFQKDLPQIPVMILLQAYALEDLILPENVVAVNDQAFAQCRSLKKLEFPEGFKAFEERALALCSSLESLVLPSTTEFLGANLFFENEKLTNLEIQSVIPPDLGNDEIFNGCPEGDSLLVSVPCGRANDYEKVSAFRGKNLVEKEFKSIDLSVNNEAWGSAKVQIRPTCSNPWAVVEAFANPGYHFVKWSDGSTNNPYDLEVREDVVLQAIFAEGVAIENVALPAPFSVSAVNGIIFIDTDDPTSAVDVLTTMGRVVYSGKARSIPVKRQAVYIVRVGQHSVKVLVS